MSESITHDVSKHRLEAVLQAVKDSKDIQDLIDRILDFSKEEDQR